jgi:pyrimidine-nucleoside phosphorylase
MINFTFVLGKFKIGGIMAEYSMYNIIDKKKRGSELTAEEIKWVIKNYTADIIPDYQLSALLMTIYFNGMTVAETAALTDAMLYSGVTLSFEGSNVIDKHSTGGIGDKASFILAPLASACGVKVPMIAGRGLGFTGGTVDKIESVAGFQTSMSEEKFQSDLNEYGLVLMGQTEKIAPADRRIYALRDVTATIDSVPLITASIMSKKLAEGANGIVMDIKTGSGAFMKKKSDAKKLARSIIRTAKRFDKGCVALITDMNQPLGNAVGNSLEIIESIETLKGNGPKDLTELSLQLAANMVYLAGISKTPKAAYKKVKEALQSGAALKEFQKLLERQGGDPQVVHDYSLLPLATEKTTVNAPSTGYIKSMQNDSIGLLCTELGGGRKVKEDKIDFGVGFVFHKKIGDKVKEGEPILTIYHHANQGDKVRYVSNQFISDCIKMAEKKVNAPDLIYERMEG